MTTPASIIHKNVQQQAQNTLFLVGANSASVGVVAAMDKQQLLPSGSF
jgi:hypothetical protein